MRASILCVMMLVGAGCHETTTTPASVSGDLATTVNDFGVAVGDLAGAPVNDLATGVTPGFPTSASVTVGPGGTLSFGPASVDIAKGGTVTWNWAANNTLFHNVTSGDNPPSFASSTQTSGTFAHTFPSAGSFFYFCTVHGRNVMNGTVNVH